MTVRKLDLTPLALTLLCIIPAARAQVLDEPPPPPPKVSGGMMGLMVGSGYQYLGSDEHRTLAAPMLEYSWASGWYAGVRGLGYRLPMGPGVEVGLGLGWDGGRKERRSDALQGLGNISARPELASFVHWQLTRSWAFDGDLRYGSGNDRNGLKLNLGVNYGIELAPRWRLSAKLGASFVNQSSMQDYFGVTSEQSLRSGYAVRDTSAGLRDVRLGLSLAHPLGSNWLLSAGVEQVRLQGDAKDSPITRQANSIGANLMLGYRF